MAPTAFVPTTLPTLRVTASASSSSALAPAAPAPLRPLPHPVPHTPVHAPLATPPAPPSKPTRVLLWFHTDLRLHDNPALSAALAASSFPGGALVPVAQPVPRSRGPAAELSARLRHLGSGLLTPAGAPHAALLDLCDRLKLRAVYFNRSATPAAARVEKRVADALARAGVRVEAFWGNILPLPDRLLAAKSVSVRAVRDAVATGAAAQPLPEPDAMPALPAAAASVPQTPLAPVMGAGTSAALRSLAALDKRAETLRISRNPDLVVLLKTHLDFGSVSPRMVAAAIKRVMGRLHGRTFSELVWRSYMCVIANRAVGVSSLNAPVA